MHNSLPLLMSQETPENSPLAPSDSPNTGFPSLMPPPRRLSISSLPHGPEALTPWGSVLDSPQISEIQFGQRTAENRVTCRKAVEMVPPAGNLAVRPVYGTVLSRIHGQSSQPHCCRSHAVFGHDQATSPSRERDGYPSSPSRSRDRDPCR